jgi:prepilin-type N-terminal cleavage/methylation domain-containing protein
MKSNNHINRRGFSLIEAMLAVVILGIAATGILLPFSSGEAVRTEGVRRTLAAKLAGDRMEELVRMPFAQVLNDYSGGCDEVEGSLTDASGTTFTDPAYANFSRVVSVQCPYEGSDGLILATVWVYYDGREVAVLRRIISKG